MNILMICKYPPIQGGVSAECYWTAQLLSEMGHAISVLTNAQEVEEEYRIKMSTENSQVLNGFSKPNSIRVVSSHTDRGHVFIPQTNPSVSKLLSLGLEMIEESRPDFIWSHYLEPYGVVAMILSKITGIPYVFKHAGSDIGRLMLTAQLKRVHEEVLRNATLVMTQPHHHDRFISLGVHKNRLVTSASQRLRSELFYPTPLRRFKINPSIVMGVYGKAGESKGSGALLRAISDLRKKGTSLALRTRWAGRNIKTYLELINELEISDVVSVEELIPHWRIPEFIRACDVILFLENRFSITFHQPSVPLEALACGRPIITTREIADKRVYNTLLQDGKNSFIIEGDVTNESVANAILRAEEALRTFPRFSLPSILPRSDIPNRVRTRELLELIKMRI